MAIASQKTVHDSVNNEVASVVDHHRVGRRIDDVGVAVGEFIEYWGFKAIHGRVWTSLALHRQPGTQAELARRLSVSRASISASIAELLRLGLVRPLGTDRQTPYEAVVDVWPAITDVLRSREWMLIEKARLAIEAALGEIEAAGELRDNDTSVVGDASAIDKRYNVERLRFLLAMTEMAQGFVRLLFRLKSTSSRGVAYETVRASVSRGVGIWVDRAADVFRRFR